MINLEQNLLDVRAQLWGSLLFFTQTFYKLRTGRDFKLSNPPGNESHFITTCKFFHKVFDLDIQRGKIHLPPGWGKSELCIHFVAWALSRYPDSKFLYISHGSELATEHTSTIKSIIQLPAYRKIFDIHISPETKAKDHFKTTAGGSVAAFGSKGAIVGHDAGLPQMDRFSGCLIIDDIHKPDEVHSDSERQRVIRNYSQTVETRLRGENVPLIFIGHRLHQNDLPSLLNKENDGNDWTELLIPAIDKAGNPRYPEKNSLEQLQILQKYKEYVFYSQYQQVPQPAGGSIYKSEDFVIVDIEPNIISTFITVDTAETDKNWNDASVFSFWGLYKLHQYGIDTNIYGLHWLDCRELRIEPKDLRDEFLDFYANCMRYKVKPYLAAIEKKSTGVTLVSVLKDMQGLRILDINRTKASGNKTSRFLEIQEYISSKRISFSRYDKHVKKCIDHCSAITANNTHAFDDIADTLYDAVKIGLIDELVYREKQGKIEEDRKAKIVMGNLNSLLHLKENQIIAGR